VSTGTITFPGTGGKFAEHMLSLELPSPASRETGDGTVQHFTIQHVVEWDGEILLGVVFDE
jgi:hypothetical protein